MQKLRTGLLAGVRFLVRHRVKIFDAGLVIVAVLTVSLFAYEIDVFLHEGRVSLAQQTIELDNLMLATTTLLAGALFYTWRRAREHRRENERRLAAEQEVMTLALHDPLTGLPNRRQFDAALKGALKSAPTAPEAHAVLLLDLNGFKKINDVHGHPVGDQVLIAVGGRLLRAVRDGDLVARLGGDEFAILARNLTGAEGATTIALRIIESLAAPVSINGVAHPVGTAIGVALAPNEGLDPEELLRKADVALYRAKAERKSAVRFFEPQMDARLRERDALERSLRVAVAAGRIGVRFQPSIDVSGAVTAFEAKPMWSEADLGEVEPERFQAVAEEAGLLATLAETQLRQACLAAAGWPKDVRLAVNLPSALLHDRGFGPTVLRILAETGVPAARLDLEVDEGALIRETDAAQAMLSPLRKAGVSVVADHFGTGYSDLKNLHRLQLDRIKIDSSFVGAMASDPTAAVMVKALIGIAQGLGLTVMADGVDGEAERASLTAQGCLEQQGAYYGDPLSAEAAAALVALEPRRRRA